MTAQNLRLIPALERGPTSQHEEENAAKRVDVRAWFDSVGLSGVWNTIVQARVTLTLLGFFVFLILFVISLVARAMRRV